MEFIGVATKPDVAVNGTKYIPPDAKIVIVFDLHVGNRSLYQITEEVQFIPASRCAVDNHQARVVNFLPGQVKIPEAVMYNFITPFASKIDELVDCQLGAATQ